LESIFFFIHVSAIGRCILLQDLLLMLIHLIIRLWGAALLVGGLIFLVPPFPLVGTE
jgi:hypothetical protein